MDGKLIIIAPNLLKYQQNINTGWRSNARDKVKEETY